MATIIVRQLASQSGRDAWLILQVHDELVFEALPSELDALRRLVKNVIEQVLPLLVPLVVDVKAGPNWRDMQPLKT